MHDDIRCEEGVALVMALMALLLMTSLGAALILTTASETAVAGNFRAASEALYAADAAVELAMGSLRTVTDWNGVLTGATRSAFVDGGPDGARTLPDGSTLDLTKTRNRANCNQPSACSAADMDEVTPDRPWGANNPRWQLYAYGRLSDVIPSSTIDSKFYVLAMVADDSSENDDNPLQDGVDGTNPGAGVLVLRAEAFGPRGAHKVVEVTIARQSGTRLLSWREVR